MAIKQYSIWDSFHPDVWKTVREVDDSIRKWKCTPVIFKDDTVYVSGPMRHHDFLNFPAFFAMEAWLREKFGCKVLNPARNESGLSYEQYMMIDLAMVGASSVIVMLDGWEKSEGATAERYEAVKNGIRIVEEKDLKKGGKIDE